MSNEQLRIFINDYVKRWSIDLENERKYEKHKISMAFSDISIFGEMLCSLITGMYGNGGSGSGHDLSNGIYASEVKTVCWAQPWKCENCEKRSPHTSKLCIHCKSNKLINPKDSRAGISASAHLKYINVLKSYYIVLIDHVKDDNYSIHVWVINSSNKYFDTYIRKQAEQTSKTCNLIPRSFDFHMSGPMLILKITMNLNSEFTFHIEECNNIENIPKKLLNKEEKDKFPEFEIDIPYNIGLERLCIRDKSYGKERGETTRCLTISHNI
jgi:hypothetical protein